MYATLLANKNKHEYTQTSHKKLQYNKLTNQETSNTHPKQTSIQPIITKHQTNTDNHPKPTTQTQTNKTKHPTQTNNRKTITKHKHPNQ